MPKGAGPMPGPKSSTPKRGMNGPMDKGPSSGTKHKAARKPPGGKLPTMTGTRG